MIFASSRWIILMVVNRKRVLECYNGCFSSLVLWPAGIRSFRTDSRASTAQEWFEKVWEIFNRTRYDLGIEWNWLLKLISITFGLFDYIIITMQLVSNSIIVIDNYSYHELQQGEIESFQRSDNQRSNNDSIWTGNATEETGNCWVTLSWKSLWSFVFISS